MTLKKKEAKAGEKKEEEKKEEAKRKKLLEEIDELMAQNNQIGYTNPKYVLTNVPPTMALATPLDEDGDPLPMPGEEKGFAERPIAPPEKKVIKSMPIEDAVFSHESLMLLDFYIQEMRKDGVPKELIKRKLERTGWPGSLVEKFL